MELTVLKLIIFLATVSAAVYSEKHPGLKRKLMKRGNSAVDDSVYNVLI